MVISLIVFGLRHKVKVAYLAPSHLPSTRNPSLVLNNCTLHKSRVPGPSNPHHLKLSTCISHTMAAKATQPVPHEEHSHSHAFNAAEHGHSHDMLTGPGSYATREMPIIAGRDWSERAFTVGIGG